MKKLKIFFSVLLSVIIFSSAVVFADNITKMIQVTYRNIAILVDGKPIPSEQEPFIYQGRTFVPLRTIGEAVNKKVEWDNEKNQIHITEKFSSLRPLLVPAYAIGEHIVKDNFALTVNSVKKGVSRHKKALIVDCTYENTGTKREFFIASLHISVFDANGNRYSPESYDNAINNGAEPGEEVTDSLAFYIEDVYQQDGFTFVFDWNSIFFIVPLDS